MPYSLPASSTPFVGRLTELAEVRARLGDSDCRLLTLVGLGGMGKTRLALELARLLRDTFADGAAFVDLPTANDRGDFAIAFADALHLLLSGQESAQRQLHDYLAERELLLILDNFEHLLAHTALVEDLLQAAPHLKLLVTSREALNLREECLYPVDGLPFPSDATSDDPEDYGAVQLFLRAAWRVRPDFSLRWDTSSVIRICQLVEGMPLALELAAAWIKTLSPRAIVGEIDNELHFLETNLRNVPDRHRSMQAVFEPSWRMLTQRQQKIFRRLSVFQGSFRRPAAIEIAEATLADLNALVDKSLLRHSPEDRYHIHDLLRQYAQQQLYTDRAEAAATKIRHRRYYVNFLNQCTDTITGVKQRQVLREIAENLENIRAAWHEVIAGGHVADVLDAVYPLSLFFDQQGRYLEAIEMLEQAVALLDGAELDDRGYQMLAVALVTRGAACLRFGQFEPARGYCQHAASLLRDRRLDVFPGFGTDPWIMLALLDTTEGHYARAIQLAEQVRTDVAARDDALNLQVLDYTLARATLALGAYEEAQEHAQRGYENTRDSGSAWMMAYILATQGDIALARGAYDAASEYYQVSYDIKDALNDPEGMAVALNGLARVALRQHKPERATALFERSRTIYEEIDDRGGLVTALQGLAEAAAARGQAESAWEHYRQALEIASKIRWQPLLLSLLEGVGELLAKQSAVEQAAPLLTLAVQHPASDHATVERAARMLRELSLEASEPVSDLAQVVEAFLLPGAKLPAATSARAEPLQELVEPLTPRENEILTLLAKGLTNPDIADRLIISVGTVKFYTSQIYSKLQVGNRTQAVVRAREVGLLR